MHTLKQQTEEIILRPYFLRILNTSGRMALFIFACIVWIILDLGMALYDVANTSPTLRVHNPIAQPMRILFREYHTQEDSFIRVQRLSPRGSRFIQTAFRRSYFEPNLLFADLELQASFEDFDNLQSISLWQGSSKRVIDGRDLIAHAVRYDSETVIVSLLEVLNLPLSTSMVPQLRGLINYRGDWVIAFWTAVRMIAFGFGFLFTLSILQRDRSEKGFWLTGHFCIGWFLLTLSGLLLSPAWWINRPLILSDIAAVLRAAVYPFFIVSAVLLMRRLWLMRQPREAGDSSPGTTTWLLVAAVFALALLLRLWNLDYLQGVDTFNLTAARALNDTGRFAYARNHHLTHLLAWVLRTFGTTLTVARIPLVLLSILAMGLIGLIAQQFGRAATLVTLFLYAISPVAIEKASVIREYGENVLLTTAVSAALILTYLRFRYRPLRAAGWMTLLIAVSSLAVLYYGPLVRNVTINSAIQGAGFLYAALICALFWIHLPGLRRILMALGILAFASVVIVAPHIGPFASHYRFPLNFMRMYFDPLASNPMQWFSFQAVGIFLPLLLSVVALTVSKHRDVAVSLFIAFWASLLLFSIRLGDTDRSRYLYHVFPFFVLLVGLGLQRLWEVITQFSRGSHSLFKTTLVPAAFVAGAVFLFWLPNTLIAARHSVPHGQAREVTSFGHRNHFYDLHELMVQHGLSDETPIVLETQNPDIFSWILNRPITRRYEISNGTPYDLAELVYWESPYYSVEGLREALQSHESGMFLTRNASSRRTDRLMHDTLLEYLFTMHNHSLYRWQASR